MIVRRCPRPAQSEIAPFNRAEEAMARLAPKAIIHADGPSVTLKSHHNIGGRWNT
jgi:hypothetical protein